MVLWQQGVGAPSCTSIMNVLVDKELEKSIFDLCLVLGVDQDDLTSDYEIPVTEDNPDYKGYFSLVKMFQNLEKIENGS